MTKVKSQPAAIACLRYSKVPPQTHPGVRFIVCVQDERRSLTSSVVLFKKLGIFDRLLTPLILVSMVVGVLIGNFVPGIQAAFDTVKLDSVSVREQPIHSID
jgi:hypothetical protein